MVIGMKAEFIESTEFTEWVSEFLPDDTYSQLQQELMDDPEKGMVMRGCGGLRKVRARPQARQREEERQPGDLFAYSRGEMVLHARYL